MSGKLRICFVKPVGPRTLVSFHGPDLGIAWLSTAARRAGWETSWIDAQAEGLSHGDLVSRLVAEAPHVVGFKVYTKDLVSARISMAALRRRLPNIIVLAGGPHVSAVGLEAPRDLPGADLFIQGEGELPLFLLLSGRDRAAYFSSSRGNILDRTEVDTSHFLDAKRLRNIPGVIFHDGHGWRANPPHFEPDLDRLGMPDWERLHPDRFPRYSLRVHGPYIPIQTARGCPFACTYCAAHTLNGRQIRMRSAEHVLGEVRWLRDRFGIRHVSIVDDCFLSPRSHLEALLDEFIRADLGICWECSSNGVRADLLDRTVVQKLERAGCYYIGVGIESGSDRILSAMKKGVTTREIEAGVRRVRAHSHMKILGYFILGYPGETREDVLATLRFAFRLPLDTANFFLFSPHPGTEAFERLTRSGRLQEPAWINPRRHLYEYPALDLPDLSARQLAWIARLAQVLFHLRPRTAWNLVNVRSLPDDLRLATGLLLSAIAPDRKIFHYRVPPAVRGGGPVPHESTLWGESLPQPTPAARPGPGGKHG